MRKPEPTNRFQQWVIDEFGYLERILNNHLKHHTRWTYGLVLAIITLSGSLFFILLRYILFGG